MPPKKTIENVKKPPRKRVVKPKTPVLKSPTIINVRIPMLDSGCNGDTPRLTKKQLTVQKKFELANEVAHSQLCKVSTTYEEAPPQIVIENKMQTTGRGKRKITITEKSNSNKMKNKTLDNSINIPRSDTEDEFEPMPPKRIYARKLTEKSPEINCDSEDAIVENSVTHKKRGRPKGTPNSPRVNENIVKNQSTAVKKKRKPRENIRKSPGVKIQKLPIKKIRKLSGEKIKKSPGEKKQKLPSEKIQKSPGEKIQKLPALKTNESPTVPLLKTDTQKSAKKTTQTNKTQSSQIRSSMTTRSLKKNTISETNNANPGDSSKETEMSPSILKTVLKFDNNLGKAESIHSRKASVNSNHSCLSWTHDLSTSSTTTCVTVTSNDFVRFDKKLPIVQMSNIEDMFDPVKKNESISPPVVLLETSKQEKEESSSSDSDSDSDSTSSSSSSSSEDTSQIARAVPSPRLSTSSISSRIFCPDDVERDTDKITIALERLAIKIKSFDSDMMDWIGNEESRVASKIQSKLAYDALKCERDVIALCRESQRQCKEPSPPRVDCPAPPSPEGFWERVPSTSFEHDNDDTLSLFAESITGIETSRLSSTTAPTPTPINIQEYVPVPLVEKPKKYCYRPTEISRLSHGSVCEKQSADSTSRPSPFLVPLPPIPDTVLFRSFCFHNLVSRCPFQRCQFSHDIPKKEHIARGLMALDEAGLKREFALLRKYPLLMRYQPEFDAEIKRRTFGKPNKELEENPLEKALQILNGSSDMSDSLRSPCGRGVWLGDAMLQELADTQNFSRFKSAFAKLARFISHNERPVCVDVATKILERVCILPAEFATAQAMLDILKLTSSTIYQGDMMSRFENQLAGLDKGLYDEYMEAKTRAVAKPLEKRYTSPDTTHLDNLNNQPTEPVLTRKVDFEPTQRRTIQNFSPNIPNHAIPYNSVWPMNSFRSSRPARTPIRRPMRRPMMLRPNMGMRPYVIRHPNHLNPRQVTYGYPNKKYVQRP